MAPEELNICKILHAQRTKALHAVKVIRKKKILQRNFARLGDIAKMGRRFIICASVQNHFNHNLRRADMHVSTCWGKH